MTFLKLFKLNTFFIFIFSFILFILFFDSNKITTNIFDLFPKVEQRELLDIHSFLESFNSVFVYTKNDITKLEIDGIKYITPLGNDIYVIYFDKAFNLEKIYNEFIEKTKSFKDIKYFSQDILNIENSKAIFDDVNIIMFSSICFLVLLYLFILRMPFLSLNTIFTIISANLLGIIAISYIFDRVNIMALNFGVAIGNLAIDYMLHHHFFGIYSGNKFKFNSSVFYGFITTFIGFFICFFVPFPLLSQLSLYALVCLFISYLSFGVLYQFIGFKQPIFYKNLSFVRKNAIDTKIIFYLSLIILAFSLPNLKLDYFLEKLDYKNIARLNDKDFFEKSLDMPHAILINGDSKDELDSRVAEVLKLSAFKGDISNLNILNYNSKFYTKINMSNDNIDSIKHLPYVDVRSIKQLSDEITSGIYQPMLIIIGFLIILMIFIMFLLTKSLISICFIITPLSVISLFLLTTQVNIMHLFSLLIVLVSSIDYGIYVNKEGENTKTIHSIVFSALTTIAGFGFLGFSNILALKSFGLTIMIGIGTILFLLLLQKRYVIKGD